MLSLVAYTRRHERVLILDWDNGRLLALHTDGRLEEFAVDRLRVDRIEAETRMELNVQGNLDLLEQASQKG